MDVRACSAHSSLSPPLSINSAASYLPTSHTRMAPPQVSDRVIPVITKHAIAVTAEAHDSAMKESLQKEEKQIAVDPMSLKQQEASPLDTPPPLQPPKSKFLSISQPNSATSSPRFASLLSKKKSKVENLESSPCQVLPEMYLQKSKSCGEGRACAPSDEFDLWLVKHDDRNHHGSISKTEETMKDSPKSTRKHVDPPLADKGFKCSCLYLPGFGKMKPVRARREESRSNIDGVISRTVSLEKFECGSWAPSPRAIISAEMEGNDSISSYFDLPSELIRCAAGDDTHSPVTAAFVFEKDVKGVLKNGTTRGRKSDASPRHVRFSTSSSSPASPASSCITPRLRRAREEFNAFLEAQSA